ncbi:tetraspanin-3-like [Lineus longissimus]|uniref:tetraspanin-3-like n=1 Tax=Lineus longissimus TaxID=88925 RepID=UPI002B4D92F3
MGCGCECVAKVFLILLNILTGLLGFLLLAVGIFTQFAAEYVRQGLKGAADVLKDQGMANVDLLAMYNELKPIVNGIAIPLIVIGAFFFIVSMFGCYGACCNKRVCLIIYAIMVTIVFVGMLVGVIYIIAGAAQVKSDAKAQVKKEIVDNFVGINATNGISLVVNIVQIYFNCCGMDNWHDFDKCKKWEKQVAFSTKNVKVTGTLLIPISCCQMNGAFPSVTLKDDQCPLTGSSPYKNTGCFSKIEKFVSEYTTYMYVALAMPLVFLAILMALGWYLWKKAGDSDMGSAAKMI